MTDEMVQICDDHAIEVCPNRHPLEGSSTVEDTANNNQNAYSTGRIDTAAGALEYFTERFKMFTLGA